MPNYVKPLSSMMGNIGAAGGSGLGGGLSSLLGKVLEPLDYPRQAAVNLYRAATGDADWQAALPGLTGLAAGALGATGFGLPAGVAIGSLGALLGQGAGLEKNPEQFKAPTTEQITGTDNPVANFAAGALMDPLTYTGIGGGGSLGEKLGQAAGSRWGRIAEGMGLGYGGGASKLESILGAAPEFSPKIYPTPHPVWQKNIEALKGFPESVQNAIFGEIPPGSKFRGMGAESLALETPQGGITKLTMPQAFSQVPPDIPEMLPRARTATIEAPGESTFSPELAKKYGLTPGSRTISVSHEPMLATGYDMPDLLAQQAESRLESALKDRGYEWWDKGKRQMGIDPRTGEQYVLDPGSIKPQEGMAGPLAPPQSSVALGGQEPGTWLERALIRPFLRRDIASRTAGEPGALERLLGQELPTPFREAEPSTLRPDSSAWKPSDEWTQTGGLAKEARGGRHVGTWSEEIPMREEKVNELVEQAKQAGARPPGEAGGLLEALEGAQPADLRQALKSLGVRGTGQGKDELYKLFRDFVTGQRGTWGASYGLRGR